MWLKIKSFLFHNQTARQTIAKNTFWLTVSNVGGRLLRAIIIIYAARVLGAGAWGTFSYAVSLVALLSVFTDLGVNAILTRETAKHRDDPEHQARILATSFLLVLALLGLMILITLFLGPHLTTLTDVQLLLPLASLILVFDTLRQFGFSLIHAIEKMEWEAGLFLLTNFGIVVGGGFFLFAHPTVRAFTLGYVAGTGLGAIATFWVLRNYFRNFFRYISFKLIRPILSASWPFAIASVLGGLMINTDNLVIGFFRSAAELGFYAAAQRPIQLLYIIPAVVAASSFPSLARLAGKDNPRFRRSLERIISLAFLAALPIAVGGIILGQKIIYLLFGGEYLPATASFQILLLTILVNFPATILSYAIFSFDRQKTLVIVSALGGISNVIFDLFFIPRFGIVGSGWATFLAQVISNTYLWWTLQRIQPFTVLPHLPRIFVATLGMSLATWGLSTLGIPALTIILLSAICYFGLLFLLKEPLLQEVRLVLQSPTSTPIDKQINS